MKMILTMFAALTILSGCATTTQPQLTRQQWIDMTSRTYTDRTPDQVLNAAEELFRLADGNDFIISHSEDGLYAQRPWSVYIVLAYVEGTDTWVLQTKQDGSDTRVSVHLSNSVASTTALPTGGGGVAPYTGAATGSSVQGTAIYDVFWARMDYLLGYSTNWMDCELANARVKQGITWGDNFALCNIFNLEDNRPLSE